jgi:hypothetical protein
MLKLVAVGAFGAFMLSGPLQHIGVLPKTPVGDASKSMIKLVLDGAVKDAFGKCGGLGIHIKGNNGWGNGEDFAPGNSLKHQPKFEDPNTGTTPSRSPRSGGGDR